MKKLLYTITICMLTHSLIAMQQGASAARPSIEAARTVAREFQETNNPARILDAGLTIDEIIEVMRQYRLMIGMDIMSWRTEERAYIIEQVRQRYNQQKETNLDYSQFLETIYQFSIGELLEFGRLAKGFSPDDEDALNPFFPTSNPDVRGVCNLKNLYLGSLDGLHRIPGSDTIVKFKLDGSVKTIVAGAFQGLSQLKTIHYDSNLSPEVIARIRREVPEGVEVIAIYPRRK